MMRIYRIYSEVVEANHPHLVWVPMCFIMRDVENPSIPDDCISSGHINRDGQIVSGRVEYLTQEAAEAMIDKCETRYQEIDRLKKETITYIYTPRV